MITKDISVKLKIVCLVIWVGILPVLRVSAESNKIQIQDKAEDVVVLTLAVLVELTEKQNLDIAIAETQIEQTQGLYVSSFSDLMPSVRGQFSSERFVGGEIFNSGTPISLNRTTLRPLASVDYQIQTGGKAIYEILASKNQLNRSKYARTRTLQTALLKSITAYFDWLKNISSVKIAEQALVEATGQLQISEDRYANGFTTKLEVSQNKTLKSEKEADLIEAQNQEQVSRSSLVELLNIPTNKKIMAENTRIIPTDFYKAEELSPSELMAIALKQRPDLKELDLLIKEAKNKYGIARADLFPTISLSSYVRGIGSDFSSLQSSREAMFSLNVDLLRNMGIGVIGNMKTNKAKVQEAKLNLQKQFNEIYKDISKAQKESILYKNKLKVSQSQINSAKEAFVIAKLRSIEGLGINLEVIQAQTELTKAQIDYQATAANYNNAQINLLHKIGELTSPRVVDSKPTSEEERCFQGEVCSLDDDEDYENSIKEKIQNEKLKHANIPQEENKPVIQAPNQIALTQDDIIQEKVINTAQTNNSNLEISTIDFVEQKPQLNKVTLQELPTLRITEEGGQKVEVEEQKQESINTNSTLKIQKQDEYLVQNISNSTKMENLLVQKEVQNVPRSKDKQIAKVQLNKTKETIKPAVTVKAKVNKPEIAPTSVKMFNSPYTNQVSQNPTKKLFHSPYHD